MTGTITQSHEQGIHSLPWKPWHLHACTKQCSKFYLEILYILKWHVLLLIETEVGLLGYLPTTHPQLGHSVLCNADSPYHPDIPDILAMWVTARRQHVIGTEMGMTINSNSLYLSLHSQSPQGREGAECGTIVHAPKCTWHHHNTLKQAC